MAPALLNSYLSINFLVSWIVCSNLDNIHLSSGFKSSNSISFKSSILDRTKRAAFHILLI